MTDVWTSAAVIVGLSVVWATGWSWADPVVALAVACNITWTAASLIRRSARGLLDEAVGPEVRGAIEGVLAGYRARGVEFHALRTRVAAGRSFVSLHVLVPGDWTVQRGHDLAETIEQDVMAAVPGCACFTHLEPKEDPASYRDVSEL